MRSTILAVDVENDVREEMRTILQADYQVHLAENGKQALAMVRKNPPDLMVLDIGLPDMDGLAVIKAVQQRDPEMVVVIVTAVDRIKTVVDAVKMGANDYLLKPLDAGELKLTIRNALEKKWLKEKIRRIQRPSIHRYRFEMIGQSPQILSLVDMARKVSKSPDTPVLITGESGTGKGVLARMIHYNYSDAPGPFVAVNATAIARDLFESEFFGYDRGAFTGAQNGGKIGHFERAAEGTLFLDEIGDIPLDAQSKLLGAIEDRTFYKVGGHRALPVSCRIITATNTRLKDSVRRRLFREDLYFRLKVVEIAVPPLRERPEDILPLARHFLVKYNEKFGKSFQRFSPEAEEMLTGYDWPGNVRELRNILERLVLLENNRMVLPDHIGPLRRGGSPSPAGGTPGGDLSLDYSATVKKLIRNALERAGGNVQEAARILNLPPHKLRYRIKKYDLRAPNR